MDKFIKKIDSSRLEKRIELYFEKKKRERKIVSIVSIIFILMSMIFVILFEASTRDKGIMLMIGSFAILLLLFLMEQN